MTNIFTFDKKKTMTLELIPNNDLIFKGPFNVVSTTTLKLNNSGNERLAYKIKTTAPKRYCVKPNSGFLDAHTMANIQVMLQPQTAGQPDDRTKHKFMVQWVAVPASYTDDVDNFWKQDLKTLSVQDSKLKCVFADETQAAVVPNNSHENDKTDSVSSRHTATIQNSDYQTQQSTASSTSSNYQSQSSPTRLRAANVSQPMSQTRPQVDEMSKTNLQQEIHRLQEENESLKNRLRDQETNLRSRVQTAGHERSSMSSDRSKSSQTGLVVMGVALNEQLVLVVFLLALLFGFSLGYFLFSCSN